ncbi:serine/threonine protein kinase [Ktedonospora formicarum]|uniref:serine/threonine protein kinase n=1 Tax=Ktedonospora formicarum TaxID=2778364 RepID=UPI001C689B6B|nr:serine/threonine-protein kinase [Ktedonospora formicarum]
MHDRYIIEELLGTGGFGAVYRVRDRRSKGDVYALKEQIESNPQQRERFSFESELLKHLDHPALPRVYSVFGDEKSQNVYMLMDFINGPNLERLRRRQREGRFTLARVMTMMKPIVDAIRYLHHQEPPIIHRDIKPSNMIIPTSGEGAVLVDFGIAKTYEQDSTTSAIRHCSPGYGSPEHYMRGTNLRSDIYGLGATFYTLLTGEVPVDALTRLTRTSSGGTDPLRPAYELVEDIPEPVSAILHKAMAIDALERYESAEAFWEALKAYIPDIPTELVGVDMDDDATPLTEDGERPTTQTTLPPPSIVVQEMPRKVRRSRMGLLPLCLILLCALALLGGLVWSTGRWMPGVFAQTTPTIAPTAIPTPSPTATPTATPTPSPTPTQPPAPPRLAHSYNGTISNTYTSPPTNSTMSLSNIAQKGENFSGYLTVGPGLVGNNDFKGSINAKRKFHFLVTGYAGLLPLYFEGTVNKDQSLSGTYCSYRNNACDHSSGYGNWHVTPG